jgi:hypothetical protein
MSGLVSKNFKLNSGQEGSKGKNKNDALQRNEEKNSNKKKHLIFEFIHKKRIYSSEFELLILIFFHLNQGSGCPSWSQKFQIKFWSGRV